MGDSIQSSFWAMVILQTLGSVDLPGKGPRRLPAPRQYLATIIAWSGLQLFADSTNNNKPAGVIGWIFVLAGMVVGPFGTQLVSLMKGVIQMVTPATSTASTTASPFSTSNA